MNTKNISKSNFKSLILTALHKHESGQLEEAINYYQQILKLKPDYAEVHFNLGNALKKQGNLEAAVESYQQAIKLKPDYGAAHGNLGNVLKQQGNLNAAICSYEQALKNQPNCAFIYCNLGDALTKRGKLLAAVESYQKALKLKPDYAEVYCNLGNALKKQGKLEAAVESYQKALNIQPDLVEAYCNLGNALQKQGKLEAAAESYQKALNIQPDLARAKLFICINQLPIIYASFAEIELRRNNYKCYLQDLAQHYKQANPQELEKAADAVGAWQPFYLAYQGLNDRNLQQIYGDMIVHLMSNRYPQWSQGITLRDLQPNEKIRIGFVSGFFYNHSNWKIPIKGWVENLDRSEFELFGYYTNTTLKQDEKTVKAAKAFDKFTQGPLVVEKWAEIIQQDKLHVLIFPEFGMDPATAELGCLRLAPIQITSWGHPDTSGLPTIDYYLSSDLMEPENAQENYTEKLVRLPNLSIYYQPLAIQPQAITKRDIGIKEDAIMFWCCQSLFKYLPQYDDVFPRIARDLDKCKFVFIQNESEGITKVFRQRLSGAFQEFGLNYQDYCIFLSYMNSKTFAGTAAIADVYLDSIGWSGCNSTLESIAHNVPVVTLSGELMRGRHSMAILKMMGIEEAIASSKEEYVQLAIRLGRDAEYRQYISQLIAQNKHKLYGDLEPIRALEEFLLKAVGKERTSTITTVAEILRLAIQEHRANRLEQAEQAYQQVLSIQPNHPEALYGLGMLAQQQSEFPEAEKFLSAAAQVQPDSVKIWFTLGNLRQLQGQLPAASAAYKRAIGLRPDAASIYNNLGYTLQQQGKWEEAITCYQKALKL
ncbi:MAG: tetratricopeptide repeat protein, partial [Pleurocapsa sp. MO_192.B19]|nr:tetratricopeptide repeat protein [Pleurocapsa sp. MO_192.B19]